MIKVNYDQTASCYLRASGIGEACIVLVAFACVFVCVSVRKKNWKTTYQKLC